MLHRAGIDVSLVGGEVQGSDVAEGPVRISQIGENGSFHGDLYIVLVHLTVMLGG